MIALHASISLPDVPATPAVSQRFCLRLLVLILFGIALAGRCCFLLRPWDNDAAIFIYMGRMVAGGGRLGHDLIDNKFPTVGLMTSIVYRLLGTCWPAYVALQTVLSLSTAAMLSRGARAVSGRSAGLPAFLFALIFLNFTISVFGGFQLETPLCFFTAMAAMAALQSFKTVTVSASTDHWFFPFWTGLAAGCGMMLKPTAVAVAAAFAVAVVFSNRSRATRLRMLTALTVGLAFPLLAAALYLWQARLFGDLPGIYRQISTYARQSVVDCSIYVKPLTAVAMLGLPLLIRAFIFRRQRDAERRWPGRPVLFFVVLWFCLETAGVIAQRRMYAYHFLPMVPAAALLFGFVPRLNRPAGLAAALLPVALLGLFQSTAIWTQTSPPSPMMPISRYILDHSTSTDAVWMDAWPRLILETGRQPASRLPFTFLFTNYDEAGLDYSAGVIDDFARTCPLYIILPQPLDRRMQYQIDFIPELSDRPTRRLNYIAGWHRIEAYTLAHYRKETMIENDAVYRRIDPAGPGQP